MKLRYRLFRRRNGIYFLQDNVTERQESFRTRDRNEARRICNVSFTRMKTKSVVQFHFGDGLANLLSDLPGEGPLFPRIAKMHEKDRAKQFMRRCKLVGVSRVSLHSYRYSWAEHSGAFFHVSCASSDPKCFNASRSHQNGITQGLIEFPIYQFRNGD